MKLGILSDTHNHLKNLQTALERLRDEGVHTIIHCGDLTGSEVARAMEEFRVICVFGNGDVASGEIRDTLLKQNHDNYAGMVYTGRIEDARIAVTHGHIPGQVEELTHAGQYDYVFKGHSHRRREERIGFTRVINPGALGGLRVEERGFCLLDLDSGKAQFIEIKSD
jgi:uncharacterized protein